MPRVTVNNGSLPVPPANVHASVVTRAAGTVPTRFLEPSTSVSAGHPEHHTLGVLAGGFAMDVLIAPTECHLADVQVAWLVSAARPEKGHAAGADPAIRKRQSLGVERVTVAKLTLARAVARGTR